MQSPMPFWLTLYHLSEMMEAMVWGRKRAQVIDSANLSSTDRDWLGTKFELRVERRLWGECRNGAESISNKPKQREAGFQWRTFPCFWKSHTYIAVVTTTPLNSSKFLIYHINSPISWPVTYTQSASVMVAWTHNQPYTLGKRRSGVCNLPPHDC